MLAIAVAVTVLSFLAPVALFALKAGLLRVPADVRSGTWDSEKALKWAASIAGGMTVLGFFGAFSMALSVIGDWPDAQRAYFAAYGPQGCAVRDTSDRCLFGSIWNVIKADAVPFFVATTILLYARAAAVNAREYDKSIWPFILPALVGGAVFFIAVHIWDWLDIISRLGLVPLVSKMVSAAIHEVGAPFVFLKAFTAGSAGTWLQNEFISLNGSFYKMASLYPKVLFIFLVCGLANYSITQTS